VWLARRPAERHQRGRVSARRPSRRLITAAEGKLPRAAARLKAIVHPLPITAMKSLLALILRARLALLILLLIVSPSAGRADAAWDGRSFEMGQCEFQFIFIGWAWSTGWDCQPGTEDSPWREEGSGSEIWTSEVCSAQYEPFYDGFEYQTWYVSYCFNYSAYTILFSN
jgi:hypothetical protein